MVPSRSFAALPLLLSLSPTFALAQPSAKDPPSPRPEEIKLPADAIIVLYEKAADALRALPKFYLLSPERYNAMMADLERVNKQLPARQPVPVSTWKITGKIRGGRAELRVTFGFVTERDRLPVTLACTRAQPTGILLDKEVPLLWQGADGLVLEVEKAGRHEAILDMVVQLQEVKPGTAAPPRPGAAPDALLGIDLDLPLTPVTSIDLELPAGVKAVEVNEQPPGESLQGNRLSGPLGKVSRLKVAWKSPQVLTGPVPLLTSRGRIEVQVQPAQIEVKAELTLQDLGRSARDWVLQLPERSRVRLANAADRDRLRADLPTSDIPDGRIAIPLVAPSGEPLTITVTYRRPRATGPMPLGPFHVEGATTQSGTLWVIADSGQRVRCLPFHTNRPGFITTPRPLEETTPSRTEPPTAPPPGASAAFQYWSVAVADRAEPREPWFRLDFDTVQGRLDSSVSHTLRLETAGGRSDWRLTTILDAQPRRTEVELLDFDWPAPWQLDRERGPRPAGLVTSFKEDPIRRRARLDLHADALKPFRLTLEATAGENSLRGGAFSGLPDSSYPSAVIRLPRPRDVLDRGGHQITVLVPESHDLRVPQPANPKLELVSQETNRLVWRAEFLSSLDQVAIAWKPYRPEVKVESTVDATLSGGQMAMKHRLQFHFEEKGRPIPAEVTLRVPATVRSLGVLEGGKQIEEKSGATNLPGGDRLVRCLLDSPRGAIGSDALLVLKYSLPAESLLKRSPEAGTQTVPVPLVSAVLATHGQSRVRLWAEPGDRVRAGDAAWDESPLEVVEGRDRLPSLVLTSLRPVQQLTLRLDSPGLSGGQRSLFVERALIQVRIGESGIQHHRARFLLRNLNADWLDLTFPAPLLSLDLQAALDGVTMNWEPLVTGSEGGPQAARLRLPRGTLRKPAVLEVSYHLPRAGGGLLSSLHSNLQAATILGLSVGVPVRWQVDVPPSWVPVCLESADASWRWGRRGWLLAPRPAVNAGDLERWFWGDGDSRGAALGDDAANLVPAYVCWRGSLETVVLYHVPQQAWLLVCSLVVLVLGLVLGNAALGTPGAERKRGRFFWPLLLLLAMTTGGAALVWPGAIGAFLHGAQPGLAVVLVVLSVQWFLHERFRRRVVFLPGFRRTETGSSPARATRAEKAPSAAARAVDPVPAHSESQPARGAGSEPRVRAEPSTVDAPPGEVHL